jgi:type II secretory pathway pseudopilin PulG
MKRHTRRSGITLVEMVVAITVGAVLMGLLGATVSRVLVANSLAGEHLEGLVALGQVAQQFRRDVHSATHAEVKNAAGSPQRLVLDADDGSQIEYQIEPTGLRRTVTQSGSVKHRETFILPGMKVIGWNDDFQTTGELALIVGWVARQGHDDGTLRNRFPIRASLAINRQWKGST